MKFLLHTSKLLVIGLVVLAGLAFQSCGKDDKPAPGRTLTQILTDSSNLSITMAALTKAHLLTFTDGPGPFTLLAPSNAAWAAVGINSAADLALIDSNQLVALLAYHIIPATRSVIEIPIGPNAPITTQNGLTLYAAKYPNGTYINGARFLSPDVAASNGWLHVINKVLIPSSTSNILTLLNTSSNFKLFSQAIAKAGTTTSARFSAAGPITVFAPTNSAFTAAGLDSTAIANSRTTYIDSLVKNHIYTGRFFSGGAGNLKTALNVNIVAASTTQGTTVKGAGSPTPANITLGDIQASNGILHTIDGVLKP